MRTADEIIKFLEESDDTFVDLLRDSDQSMVTIWRRVFFGTTPEFLFELNGKAVKDCKAESTAKKVIAKFIDDGFEVTDIFQQI